jgi:hypothetical protein
MRLSWPANQCFKVNRPYAFSDKGILIMRRPFCISAFVCFITTIILCNVVRCGYEVNRVQIDNNLRVFVGVLSLSVNQDKRAAIRETWGSDPRLSRVVFILSKPREKGITEAVHQEILRHNDVVVVGHVLEHYFNITHQTLELFRTAYAFHGNITHVLKCDDDSYIHVGRLLSLLTPLPHHYTWAGAINRGYTPNRDPKSKWFVSKVEWAEDHSSMYWSHGPGYVLTMDLARLLSAGAVSQCMPEPLFKLEDIAIGSWLTCLEMKQHLNITKVRSRVNLLGCAPADIISHYMSPNQMRCMFKQNGMCCS